MMEFVLPEAMVLKIFGVPKNHLECLFKIRVYWFCSFEVVFNKPYVILIG